MFVADTRTLTLSLILVGVGIQGGTTSLEGEQGMPPRSHSASAQRQQKDGTVASGAKSSATGKHPRRYWQDMTTEDFAALDADRVIAVLPVASIEQHGPHLPVCADACSNQAVIERTLELLPDELQVTVLPMMPVGKRTQLLSRHADPRTGDGAAAVDRDRWVRPSGGRPETRPVQQSRRAAADHGCRGPRPKGSTGHAGGCGEPVLLLPQGSVS